MISKTLLAFLSSWIIENTQIFEKILEDPSSLNFQKRKCQIKTAMSKNCRVKAYYVKDNGIYYIDQLDPRKQYM